MNQIGRKRYGKAAPVGGSNNRVIRQQNPQNNPKIDEETRSGFLQLRVFLCLDTFFLTSCRRDGGFVGKEESVYMGPFPPQNPPITSFSNPPTMAESKRWIFFGSSFYGLWRFSNEEVLFGVAGHFNEILISETVDIKLYTKFGTEYPIRFDGSLEREWREPRITQMPLAKSDPYNPPELTVFQLELYWELSAQSMSMAVIRGIAFHFIIRVCDS